MDSDGRGSRFLFPPWTNLIRPLLGIVLVTAPAYLVLLVWLGGSPKTTDVGYEPVQPVPFSHELHAGEMGLDCRYCHTTVDQAAFAAVPPTQTCMNCHAQVRINSPKLISVRESYATGRAIPWVKVHDMPDYVYFDHSAHVVRGVACVSCHGRVDRMELVRQVETLSMGWCLDCHRKPDSHLRPPELVTAMDWTPPEDPAEYGRVLREARAIAPSVDCAVCHR